MSDLAQVAQTAQQLGGISLLGSALVLGIRHGIDWDHIAAITDIASTSTTGDVSVRHRGTFAQVESRALWLSFLYAVGHATVVALLGILALSFAALLPEWIDPLMERTVGATLLVLGVWVFYSLVRYARGGGDFRLQSRWMVIFAAVRHASGWLRSRLGGHEHHHDFHVEQYGPRTALGVGAIHGIGAETGSQALLIAAIGGAASQGLGVGMLLAFVIGLVLSNTLIAVLASTGYISSSSARPFYVTLGVFTGVFSIFVGAYFLLGMGADLPDLQSLIDSFTA